jgi:NADPH-dependent curcumin reductase CurA
MAYPNTRVRLASRPVGLPRPENLTIDTVEMPPLTVGQVLVKISLISLAPAMRVWMGERKSYVPPIGIGEVFGPWALAKSWSRSTLALRWATT